MGVDAVRHAADDANTCRPAWPAAEAARRSGCRPRWCESACPAGRNSRSRPPAWVEGVEVRRAAPHPNLDHRLGLGLGRRRSARPARRKRSATSKPAAPASPQRIASRRLTPDCDAGVPPGMCRRRSPAPQFSRLVVGLFHGETSLRQASMSVEKLRAIDQRPDQVHHRPPALVCRAGRTRRWPPPPRPSPDARGSSGRGRR